MPKVFVALSCVLLCTPPVFAESDDPAVWEEDAKTYIAGTQPTTEADNAEDLAELVQLAQWGGSSRVWTCFARNPRSGRTFSGQSRNANSARRIALNRCNHRTSGCRISSCR